MKLIYIPNQQYSVLQLESVDDLDHYVKVEEALTCKAPDSIIAGYQYKMRRAKKQSNWDGNICFIKESLFLTGLVFIVRNILKKHDISHTFTVFSGSKDLEANADSYNKLRPLQKDIVENLEKHYQKYGFIRKLINVPIGSGKSYLIENFSKLFPPTTSILIVESLTLFQQYIESGVVDAKKRGIVAGKVNIMMSGYYCKHYSEISRGLKDIDFLMLDEVHLERVKSVVEKYPIKYLRKGLLGFTATLPDELLHKMNLYGYISSSLYKRKYSEVYMYMPTVKIVKNENRPPNTHNLSYHELCNIVVNSAHRMELICNIINHHSDKKILIAVEKIENNLKPLARYLKTKGIKFSYIYGKQPVEKRMKRMRLLKKGKINVLIASSVAKAGINLEEVDILILNTQYVSSIPVIQFVGRLIRKHDPSIADKIFYDIYDATFSVFRKQMVKRVKIYKSMDWKVTLSKEFSDQ